MITHDSIMWSRGLRSLGEMDAPKLDPEFFARKAKRRRNRRRAKRDPRRIAKAA